MHAHGCEHANMAWQKIKQEWPDGAKGVQEAGRVISTSCDKCDLFVKQEYGFLKHAEKPANDEENQVRPRHAT